MDKLLIHVFLLVLNVNGVKESDDLYFYSVSKCSQYAIELNITMGQGVNAYCVPKYVDIKDPTIKVYR